MSISRRFALVTLAAVTVVVWQARPVDACSCVQAGFELVSPAPGQAAPTNTRVRVAYVERWAYPVRVVLRAGGVDVAGTTSTFASGEARIVELTPDRELLPETTYEVFAVELGRLRTETVVGRFTTGEGADGAAPTWQGVRKAVYVKERSKRVPADSPVESCVRPDPYAVLVAHPAADDDTPTSGILYAVWMPDARGHVDTSAEPLTYVPIRDGRISLGSASRCDPRRFSFPPRARVELGVAAVDHAGNRSAPVKVMLRLSRPARQRPR